MSQAAVGRWGRSLAIRVPVEIARACGLAAHAQRRSDAEAAAAEIMAESGRHALDVPIRDLLDEGRRG